MMFQEEKNVENEIANLSYRHVHKVLIVIVIYD
jgi:hypothetical protein